MREKTAHALDCTWKVSKRICSTICQSTWEAEITKTRLTWVSLASWSCSCRPSSSYPKDTSTSPCLEIKIQKNTPWTLEGPFLPKSYWADVIFVKCDAVHGQPVCPLVLKAVNRALGACHHLLIKSKMAAVRPNQQRQPACVAFALPHQMPHFTGYFPLQEIVSPTGNRAWHWDETRWFTLMV